MMLQLQLLCTTCQINPLLAKNCKKMQFPVFLLFIEICTLVKDHKKDIFDIKDLRWCKSRNFKTFGTLLQADQLWPTGSTTSWLAMWLWHRSLVWYLARRTCCLKESSVGRSIPAVLSVVVASTWRSSSSVSTSLPFFPAYNSKTNFLADAIPSRSSSWKLANPVRLSAYFTRLFPYSV